MISGRPVLISGISGRPVLISGRPISISSRTALDFRQAGLDFQKAGLDLWHGRKTIKVALSAPLKPTVTRDLQIRLLGGNWRTFPKKRFKVHRPFDELGSNNEHMYKRGRNMGSNYIKVRR